MLRGTENYVRFRECLLLGVRRGYTIVELMVTIVVVSVLAAIIGIFIVKLLTIQEREREEAYIRERLSDVCSRYADFVSIGSSFSVSTNSFSQTTLVKYQQETGGVSLETGLVSRVAYLESLINITNNTIDLNIFYATDENDTEGGYSAISRIMRGDAALIPFISDMVDLKIIPLTSTESVSDENFPFYQTTDAALGKLVVTARYKVKNDEGLLEEKAISVERVIRLWNRE